MKPESLSTWSIPIRHSVSAASVSPWLLPSPRLSIRSGPFRSTNWSPSKAPIPAPWSAARRKAWTPTVFNTPTPDKVLKFGQGLQVLWKVSTRNLKIEDFFNPRSKKNDYARWFMLDGNSEIHNLYQFCSRSPKKKKLTQHTASNYIPDCTTNIDHQICTFLPSHQSSLWDMVEVNHDPRPRPCLQLLRPKLPGSKASSWLLLQVGHAFTIYNMLEQISNETNHGTLKWKYVE